MFRLDITASQVSPFELMLIPNYFNKMHNLVHAILCTTITEIQVCLHGKHSSCTEAIRNLECTFKTTRTALQLICCFQH